MRSVVDRNVVMRRMTVHPLYSTKDGGVATFCDVTPCGKADGTDISDKPEMLETASYTGTTAVHV
jgi:hypothetical protein